MDMTTGHTIPPVDTARADQAVDSAGIRVGQVVHTGPEVHADQAVHTGPAAHTVTATLSVAIRPPSGRAAGSLMRVTVMKSTMRITINTDTVVSKQLCTKVCARGSMGLPTV